MAFEETWAILDGGFVRQGEVGVVAVGVLEIFKFNQYDGVAEVKYRSPPDVSSSRKSSQSTP